jgi:prophage regulatory protein
MRSRYGIPYSHQHIARLEKAGKFPRRMQLGQCRVAWYCSAVEAWIASRRQPADRSDAS